MGGIGSWRLTDANYCSWNGFTMRSCLAALRTMSRYLHCNTTMGGKATYTCMCNWVPTLNSGGKKKVSTRLQVPFYTRSISPSPHGLAKWMKQSSWMPGANTSTTPAFRLVNGPFLTVCLYHYKPFHGKVRKIAARNL